MRMAANAPHKSRLQQLLMRRKQLQITGSYQGVRQQASGATGICGQAWAESP